MNVWKSFSEFVEEVVVFFKVDETQIVVFSRLLDGYRQNHCVLIVGLVAHLVCQELRSVATQSREYLRVVYGQDGLGEDAHVSSKFSNWFGFVIIVTHSVTSTQLLQHAKHSSSKDYHDKQYRNLKLPQNSDWLAKDDATAVAFQ